MSDDAVLAVLALGGNLGGDDAIRARMRQALAAITGRALGGAVRVSSVYRTAPVGPVADQPAFLNAVAAMAAPRSREPRSLLAALLDIERALGRDRARGVAQGPRAIDLDLLTWADLACDAPARDGAPALTLPHPRMAGRGFVLVPLAELLGAGWVVPGLGRSVGELLAALPDAGTGIERLGPLTPGVPGA